MPAVMDLLAQSHIYVLCLDDAVSQNHSMTLIELRSMRGSWLQRVASLHNLMWSHPESWYYLGMDASKVGVIRAGTSRRRVWYVWVVDRDDSVPGTRTKMLARMLVVTWPDRRHLESMYVKGVRVLQAEWGQSTRLWGGAQSSISVWSYDLLIWSPLKYSTAKPRFYSTLKQYRLIKETFQIADWMVKEHHCTNVTFTVLFLLVFDIL